MSDGATVDVLDDGQLPSPVSQPEETEQSKLSAGAQLVALREAGGVSVEEIARQLNLSLRQVQALESDDHAALPRGGIVRGFIRAYAKLLHADPAPILEALEPVREEIAPLLSERAPLAPATFSERSSPFGKRRLSLPMMAGAVAVLLLLVLFSLMPYMGWLPFFYAPSLTEKNVVVENVVPSSSVTLPLVTAEAGGQGIPAPVSVSMPKQVTDLMPHVSDEAAHVAPPAVVSAAATETTTVTAPPANAIVFELQEDSWIEMRRSDDTVLVSRIFKAGTTESFKLFGPISLTIGNAAGVRVHVRGKPLDVGSRGKGVVRLNVK